ncbi:MAG TPA: tRNA pseudouridine(38-40) synthase TruA, partial [Cytophagales bacterium]|nr:tRNA pseudouridine(38-40) synthase TruA [Cytophagales bacterium]
METRYELIVEYLGYGYHGWQTQPQVKTVQGTLERVLRYVTGHERVRTLAAGRTDAGVSADAMPVQLILDSPVDTETMLPKLNDHLPTDIRVIFWEKASGSFNILESVEWKMYSYRFSLKKLVGPRAAPFVAGVAGPLDTQRMEACAALFEGNHDFRAYGYQVPSDAETERMIRLSKLEYHIAPGNGLPRLWEYSVMSAGFMRHQVRLMVGSIIACGQGQLKLA